MELPSRTSRLSRRGTDPGLCDLHAGGQMQHHCPEASEHVAACYCMLRHIAADAYCCVLLPGPRYWLSPGREGT